MSWSEELCRLCLTVSNVPIALPKDSLYNYVQNHAGIKIVDSGTVDGIESDSSLTRWVLLLPSEKDVQYMIGEVQNEQVEVNEKSFTIVYQKAIACELPDHWEDTYKNMTDKNTHGTEEQSIKEQSEQAPNTDSFNAEPPPGQGNPAYHHPHMYSSGYPVGPYGAMSGFYVNVPQHENTPQGRTDLTNTRQVDQNTSGQIQQTQMPFMQMPHPAYNRFGPPRPGYPHQGQIQPQNQPTSQSNQNFRQDQSHMRGPFPYNVPFSGYPVYPPMGMPQGGNIPFHPGMMQMPMMFDQHSGQFVPVSSAGMPSAPPMSPLDSSKGSADETRNVHSDPPPPYNSHEYGYSKPTEAKQRIFGEHTETTFPSRAISDQDKEFRKFRDPSFADSQDRTGEGDAQSEKEAPVSQDIEEKREKSDTTVERPTKILVSNLPSTAHEDFLELFFENTRKYGGGPVFHIELDEENASAVIEFEDSDAVERVLTKCPIKMMGQEVDVQIYVPEPPPPRCTIEVTGPPDVICEDQLSLLEMYFENERRSGGGAVVEAVYDADKNMALITFETENVALRVEEKAKHSVKQQNVFVKLHIPETNQKKLKKTESVEEGANMQKEKPKCMVKVKGVDKSASRDTFEFYFENERRSGGGEIDVIKSDEEEDDVLYVTFKKPEVAKRVADREHSVENQNLKASLFEPPKQPPCYDDRVLIKGLNPSTTQDCLFNFIEAKTGLIPDKLDYHAETEGVAMVTFLLGQGDEEFDFEKLVRVFSKNKLEGASLKIARVPVSNCILVSNLAQEVTKDTVEFYFENVRKSGGGQVQKVVMNEDDSCLVFFQDYLVIDAVVQREHTLINQKLEVLRFQECLCKPEGEIAERKLRIPEAVFISDVDVSKVKFLTASKANTEAIKTQLEACHTIIIWQQQQGNVMLQCTITSKTPDCYKLVKVWREKAMKNFEDFMKLIVVHKVPVLQEIWQKVMEELKTVTIEKPDAVALFVDKSDGVVTIVGYKLVADSLAKKINEIAKRVMEEAEKEKHKVKEVVTNLKPVETKMLLADKFPTKMESQFSELKVKINQGKNEITFEGMLGDVQGAKIKMYEMKSSFAFATVESVSTNKLELYHQKQTKEHIVKKLKANGVVAVWEVTDNNLTVVSLSEDQLQISKNLILQSVIDKSIALKPSSKSVMSSEQWNIKKDELHTVNAGRCLIAVDEIDSKIHVCGTDDIVVDVFDSVNNYLRLHTVGEEKIPCTKHVHRLIERFHKDEISKITKELQNYHVQIISLDNYGGFEIRGTEDGIRQAKAKLDSLLNRVRYHEELLTKPGLGEHMQTPKGKDSLNTIETQLKCVVTVKTEDENDERFRLQGEAAANFGNKGVVITACCKAFDTRKIYTVKGDMTELTVDAFVNPADDKLSLSGGLGKAFLQKGGKSIMQECGEFIKSEGHLGDGELFVSKAGNLQAKVIVHVIGPVWKGGMNKEEEMLSEAVFKCLMQASSRNLKSIALPAISCGSFGYPLKKATMTIVQSVKNFFREEQESTLDDVYLCDVKQDTVEGYNEALGKEFGPHNLQHMQKPSTSDFNEDEDDDGTIRPMNSDEEEYYASNSQAPRLPQRGGATNESEVFVGKIKVSVVKGELAKQKVDLIVNTTAKNLDLKNGAVSLSLLKCGGPELQQEVSQKYPNGIKDGEIAVTSGQKLNCSAVVHTSLGNWDQANDTGCIKTLHALMNNCLNVAERKNLKSVAFPAIGTGNLGYPRDVVAAEMFAGVSQFSDKTQQPCVKEVRFIVYQKDFSTIKAFEDELKRWATGSQRGTTVGKERQTRNFDAYEDLRTGRQQLFKDKSHQNEELASGRGSGDYKFGCVEVKVITGDITKQDCDCIVNSSNDSLDLNRGAVSQAILKKGGKHLAKEIQSLQSKMKKDHIVMTSAPGLNCKKIIHIVATEAKDEWKTIAYRCLQEAENYKMESIAFPALGTGIQMEPSFIANAMLEAIVDFEKSKPKYLRTVRFVIFNTSMTQDFHLALQRHASKGRKDTSGRKTSQNYSQPPKRKKIDPNSVTFIILALSDEIIAKAIQKLESYIDKEIHKKVFDDSIIRKMDDNQLMEIRAIAQQHNLELQMKSDSGSFLILGMASNVMAASDKIHGIMRDAATLEQQKNSAVLLSSLVQWYYIEITEVGQDLVKYQNDLNYKIETAYRSQAANVKFVADNVSFVLDFNKMEEYEEDNTDNVVTVIRRDLVKESSFEAPPTWGQMTGNLRVVILQASDQEYQDISQKFISSAGQPYTVTKIERIQNKTLWAQYQAKKKQLDDQNPLNTRNENFLWHGTAAEAVDNINFHGFNRSYCGKNATFYGDGVYFAVNANYSCSNTYARPDATGVKRVYYCRVLTGVFCQGKQGMRVPPAKTAGSSALYDSVVDNPNGPGMYIIFHDTQAYPEYLVSFR